MGPLRDTQRDEAISRLRRAAEDGSIEPAVLDARIGLVRAARTQADLDAALHGIDGMPSVGARTAAPGPSAPPAGPPIDVQGAPGYSRHDPLRIFGGMSAEVRDGQWNVPPFILVRAAMSGVRLDFRDAVAVAPVIEMTVQAGMSTLRLVLPEGWGVDTSRLSKDLGSIKSRALQTAAPGMPQLVVLGNVGAGTFKAGGTNWTDDMRDSWRRRRA